MLVRSAGDRATSAQPPTLVRLYVALCLTYHPSLHPPSLSLSPFARSPPSSAWDIPYIRSLDAAATLTRARTHTHHLQPTTFRCNLCVDVRGSVHERPTTLYVRVVVDGGGRRFMQKCTLPGYV